LRGVGDRPAPPSESAGIGRTTPWHKLSGTTSSLD